MDKESHIGVIYNRDDKAWIAGSYYIENIVKSMALVNNRELPVVHVLCQNKKAFIEFTQRTKYPKLVYEHKLKIIAFLGRVLNYLSKRLRKKESYCFRKYNFPSIVKLIYPVNVIDFFKDKSKLLAWIPDLQERHLPEFFSPKEILHRKNVHLSYIKEHIPIVFSSQDSERDFKQFYPAANVRTFVLPFAVHHPNFSNENINLIKDKYKIDKNYLFCANQFWMHKNHKFLFKSFAKAISAGLNLQLVCSGLLYDKRNPLYGDEILNLIKELKMENDIKLLGFIDRKEQLCLIKNSYALIQPSLFEGWNTTVEDAKRLNKFIFLSNLNVHLEQNPKNVCFFNPRDTDDLVYKLINTKPTEYKTDYSKTVITFGENFIDIVSSF